MSNPNLPEGTDLRDVEGRMPFRAPAGGVGAGSIAELSAEQIAQDREMLDQHNADRRAALAEVEFHIAKFFS
jgi:hypothetical protein